MRTVDQIMEAREIRRKTNPVRLCKETKRWVYDLASLEEGEDDLILHRASVEPLRTNAPVEFHSVIVNADAMTAETMQAQINTRRASRANALNALYERIYRINGDPDEWLFLCVRERIRQHGLSLIRNADRPDARGLTDQGFALALEELSQYNVGPGDCIRVEPEEFMDSSKPTGLLVRVTNELFHAKFGGMKFIKLSDTVEFY